MIGVRFHGSWVSLLVDWADCHKNCDVTVYRPKLSSAVRLEAIPALPHKYGRNRVVIALGKHAVALVLVHRRGLNRLVACRTICFR